MGDVHDATRTWSDERVHVMDRTCWCQPHAERRAGGELIVHRVTVDDLCRLSARTRRAHPDGLGATLEKEAGDG